MANLEQAGQPQQPQQVEGQQSIDRRQALRTLLIGGGTILADISLGYLIRDGKKERQLRIQIEDAVRIGGTTPPDQALVYHANQIDKILGDKPPKQLSPAEHELLHGSQQVKDQ